MLDAAKAASHPAIAEALILQQQERIAALVEACKRLDNWWHAWAAPLPYDEEVERAEWDEWQAVRRAMAAATQPPQNPPLPAGFAFQEPQQCNE